MYHTGTYFFSSSPLLSSSHLLTFSLLSSIPFFPFSFSFLSQFLSLYLYPFLSLPVIFPFLHFSPFPFFFHSFLLHLPCPSSSLSHFPLPFLISLSPSFSARLTFLPSLSSPSPSPVFPIHFFFYSNTWNPELGEF